MSNDTSNANMVPGFDDDLVDPKLLKKNLKTMPIARLMAGLRSSKLAVRANSAVALGLHGKLDEGSCMGIAVLLRDESSAVRGAAARGLQGAADPTFSLDKLLIASADKDPSVIADVAETVHARGAAIIPALVAALQRDPSEADTQVVPHLVAFGKEAEKPVIEALGHDDERVRANAIATLIQLGGSTLIAHQDRIREMISDPSSVVCKLVIEALSAVDRREGTSLLEPRKPPTPGFGDTPIAEVDAKKLASKTDEETLLHFSRDGRDAARRNAWLVLSIKGKPSPSVTALAAVATKDRDTKVRANAAVVLGGAHKEHLTKAVLALVSLLDDSQDAVIAAAEAAIDGLGKSALNTLLDTMDQRDGDLARLHTLALIRFGQAAGTALKTKASDSSPVTRTLAREALSAIGGKALIAASQVMIEGLHDPWDPARAASAFGVGTLVPEHVKDPEAVIDRLKQLFVEDGYLQVRNAAERALLDIALRESLGKAKG